MLGAQNPCQQCGGEKMLLQPRSCLAPQLLISSWNKHSNWEIQSRNILPVPMETRVWHIPRWTQACQYLTGIIIMAQQRKVPLSLLHGIPRKRLHIPCAEVAAQTVCPAGLDRQGHPWVIPGTAQVSGEREGRRCMGTFISA